MRLPNLAGEPFIYLITDGSFTNDNFHDKLPELLELLDRAKSAGVHLFQIREKKLSTRLLFIAAQSAVRHRGPSGPRILVNDRADIALAAEADGVHLTSASIGAEAVRNRFPPHLIIGVSTHTASEVADAARSGADFAVFGPVFASPGKGEPVGIEALRDVCRESAPFPILALGGIDDRTAAAALGAGASGYAAIRYLNDPSNLRRMAESPTGK